MVRQKNSASGRENEAGRGKGAKDDWEALKILLDGMPSLKQRVLHKLRELKARGSDADIKVSRKARQDYMREAHRHSGKKK